MAGLKVWVTRTAPGAERTADAVRKAGFEPVVSPLLIADPAFRAEPLDPGLDDVAALAFTSVNGLALADLTPRRDLPVFTVGDRTAQTARDRGFTEVVSANGDAGDLARLIATQWGQRSGLLLVATAARPAADLAALLADHASDRIRVRTIAVYGTIETTDPLPAAFDIALMHSTRAAEVLARRLPVGAAAGRIAIALSDAVAAPLHPLGFAELRIAAHPDERSLIAALGKAPPAV